jgi:YVTN family beta-propeller protein
MSVNTALTAEVTPANATYAADPILANQSLVYWFNDAAPNNSLVFAGLGSLVSFWRGDFRNGGTFTEANRQGQFRQTNDTTSSDLQFFFSGGVGYLLTAGDRGNIWCYAFDPSTVVGGCAVILVDAGTTAANLLAGSTTLDLNNGNGTFQTAPTVGDSFTVAGGATTHTLSAASIIALSGTITVGTQPFAVSYAPTSDRIYVANNSANNVSVINPVSNAVVATITVGTGPRAVGYAPTSDRIYVANLTTNNVSVVNPDTNAVVATITVGTGPFAVAYAPTSDRIYVANQSGQNVSVINPVTNAVVATITVGTTPRAVGYAPTSDRIYVANNSANNVSVVDPVTNAVVATITVGTGPRAVGYAPTSDRIYVANSTANNVSVINPVSNAVVATITVGTGPIAVGYAPTSDRIYVANEGNVSVVNPVSNAVVATITVGSSPFAIAYAPTSDRIYVVNFASNNVSVVNPRTNLVDAGTRARVTFAPGLTNAVAVGDALQFWGAGNKFVSARLRLASVAFPSAARLSTDLANGFASIRNTSTATFYRNLILANFNGTSSVTVNGTSIAPNAETTIGYYNIATPVFSVNVTARDLDFYYKAGTSYLIATSTTNQLFLYAFDAATVSSAPAVKATFTTNGLSASTPRHLSFTKAGSDLALLVVGDTINLLYRFADNIFDGTGTITINGQTIAHSSGYAVPTSAALFYWLHNTTATDSLLGALYHNTVANRTVIAFVTTAGVNAYELNLDAFDGTATVNVKGTQVAPTSRQYTLPEYLSSFQIPSYTAPLALSYNSTDAANSFISGNNSRIARLNQLNRFNTVIDLLTQSYTTAPAITKTSANGALTLFTAITAFQALSILVIGASLISLRNSDGSTGYANGEFYPYAYTATDDAEGTFNEGFTLSGATAGITGTYRFTMAAGTTLTLSSKATYNDNFTVSSGATLAISQNTTIGSNLILQTGANVVAANNVGPFTLTIPYSDPGLIYDPTKIIIVSQIRFTAPNFADGSRAYAARVQSFTVASTAINTTTDAITLGNDSQGRPAAFATAAPWTQVRFSLNSGATLPTTTSNVLKDGGFYYWSDGKLFASIANIPSTPVDFTSQGSGDFTLAAETELFNVVVSGGSGLAQNLSLPNGALVRLKATYWAESGGTATSGRFLDTRDSLLVWSITGGITVGAAIGPTVLEPIHEAIVASTQIQSNKYGVLTPANTGSGLSQFAIALEGVGTLQINSNDTDGVELIQNIFLWWCWVRSTEAGIRLASFDTLEALSFTSYQAGRVEVENTNSTTPLSIAGGSITFPGSSTGIAATSYAINLNADVFGTGATTGLTSPEIRQAVGLASANLDSQLSDLTALVL